MLIGSNLKTYFSHARTLEWMAEIGRRTASGGADYSSITRFVLPQHPSIPAAVELGDRTGLVVGAQDVSESAPGAYTGEADAGVLAELGCRFALIGHAERRARFAETNATVAAKVDRAFGAGLTPILCVGEMDDVGAAAAAAACREQLASALAVDRDRDIVDVVVAYEPVWAIGAAHPADAAHVAAVCSDLREALVDRGVSGSVIYGGSARRGLLEQVAGSVDGLFLGRFAHDPAEFHAILDEAVAVAQSTAPRA